MFDKLEEINSRPAPFQFYTAEDLWTDDHTSKKMLEFHLNETLDLYSDVTGSIFSSDSPDIAVVARKAKGS